MDGLLGIHRSWPLLAALEDAQVPHDDGTGDHDRHGGHAHEPASAGLEIFQNWHVKFGVARPPATPDIFHALAGADRRRLLDVLVSGEKAVGTLVSDLSMSQPQVSKHLRVLSEAGLVKCRAQGRRRLYRLDATRLRPLRDWLTKYEGVMEERLDQMDDYLRELQAKESQGDP